MAFIDLPDKPNREPQKKIDIVIEKFNQTKEYADEAYDSTVSLLENLVDTVNDIADVDTDIPFGNAGFLPIPLPFNIEEYLAMIPANPITAADYENIENLRPDEGLVLEDETDYDSALLDLLKEKLTDVLNGNGATLISSALTDQIWYRETEQGKLANQEAKEKQAAEWAERGLDLPGGGLFHMTSQIETEFQNKLLDKARAIAEESRKLEIENMWKAIDNTRQLEVSLIELHNRYWQRKLDAAIKVAEVALAIYTGAIEALKMKAQAYGAEAAAYGEEMKAIAAIGDLYAELNKAIVAYETARSEAAAKEVMAELQEAQIKANVALESIKASAQIAAQLCASALSAVSAQASIESRDSAEVRSSLEAREEWNHNISSTE